MYDIMQAGLTTKTSKDILSSNGMFYIGVQEKAEIKKPFSIVVPSSFADRNMQLYKGKESNGKIVWEQPADLSVKATYTDTGELLYKSNCSSCHAIENNLTGPALGWITKRREINWLYSFTKNNQKLIKEGNRLACCVYESYNKTAMNIFPNLSEKDLQMIYRYIDKQSQLKGLPENFRKSEVCDSCEYYIKYADILSSKIDSLNVTRKKLIQENGSNTKITIVPPNDTGLVNDSNGVIPTKISPPVYDAEYYQVSVEAFGWYNIDDLIYGKFNSVETKLEVSINEYEFSKVNVFLVIPQYKVFADGGILENGNSFGFYTNDGKLFLPPGSNAFVFGFAEEKGATFFGINHFITTKNQSVSLTLSQMTKEEINSKLSFFETTEMKMSVNETKNFDSITQIDNELEQIKQHHKVCDCYSNATDSASHYY